MSKPPCQGIGERLPLLHYPDELSAAEREQLQDHLSECEACQRFSEELKATAARLDSLPLERPSEARFQSLKAGILERVYGNPCPQEAELLGDQSGALVEHLSECPSCQAAQRDFAAIGLALDTVESPPQEALARLKDTVLQAVAGEFCPQEAQLLMRAELSSSEALQLDQHVAECASCSEAQLSFSKVALALDQVPLESLSELQLARTRTTILETVGAPASQVRWASSFRARLARLAAAILVAMLVGFGSYELLRPNPAAQMASLQGEAEKLLRGEQPLLGPAIARYERVLLHARSQPSDPRVASLAARARYQKKALEALPLPKAATQGVKGYRQVITEYPDSHAARFAIRALAPDPSDPDPSGRYVFKELDIPDERLKQVVARHLKRKKADVLRYDYRNLDQRLVKAKISDPGIRQAALLQRGLIKEELGELADARKHYQETITLDPDSKAAEKARLGLARLS